MVANSASLLCWEGAFAIPLFDEDVGRPELVGDAGVDGVEDLKKLRVVENIRVGSRLFEEN